VTPFEHLAVLISIIVGLGIAQVLVSVHRLVQCRDRVRVYWLSLVWAAIIFVGQIEWWWASFAFRQQAVWNFFYFLFILLSPVSLFVASAFVLPELPTEAHVDLREYYFRTRGWFFGAVAMGPALDAIRRGTEAGTIRSSGVWTNVVAAVLIASLAFTRRPVYHTVVTGAVAALFLSFVIGSALQLR
jgi:hypothetical protein